MHTLLDNAAEAIAPKYELTVRSLDGTKTIKEAIDWLQKIRANAMDLV